MSACPVSSWSSRARRRRSSSCAATTRRTASRATRCERSTATAAREANVSASRRSSSEKRAAVTELVVDGDHADRAVADDQRHPEARARGEGGARSPGRLGVVVIESTRSLRALEHGPLFDFRRARSSPRAAPGAPPAIAANAELVRAARKRDATTRAPSSSRRRPATRSSSGSKIGLGRERVPDLVQRLEPLRPAARAS